MIESFFYGAWIGGQAVYWFFLRHQTALLGEEYWQMLKKPLTPSCVSWSPYP
jgi:hypothetical protein